ncbi:YsnF/AvaK domain-containing protein (plasmid) [Skermanella mucosa]|uniref:YsnF/AvaK domain-containing protein n=1 Tax=Skermanella mucosa TaxID=1789672 RepID=UPI00192C97DE|nr:YsnF/AvaK domain-containing protein [Skermanella mucosa]UEM24692.1 YsnF/AvaK domain-containing protein [Skermanella mucosa]
MGADNPVSQAQIIKEFSMTTSIIGLFENSSIANKVLGELTKAGFQKSAVEILQDVAVSKISSRLVEAGYEKDKADSYGNAMQKGGALVVAEADDDKADDALSTMRSFKALTPEALLEKLGNRTDEATGSAQVIEEELEVGVSRTTGGKRLKTEVSEREVQETVTLHEENVEVEHTKVDRVLKPEEAAKAFQEGTIEMTEVSEKPVVTKQAHVVEEVALSKHSGERDVTVSGTVRRQDVTVEEIDRKPAGSKAS